MQDFGPRLPPHLLKRKAEENPKFKSRASSSSRSSGSDDSSGSSSDDMIGPVPVSQSLPVSKKKKRESQKSAVRTVDNPLDKTLQVAQDKDETKKSLLQQHQSTNMGNKLPLDLNQVRNIMAPLKRESIIEQAKSLDSRFTKNSL